MRLWYGTPASVAMPLKYSTTSSERRMVTDFLGLELIVNSPHYARFKCPEGDSTFSVHLAAEAPSPSVVVYFEVADLDETVRKLQNNGMSFFQEPRDEPWLWREARISDPSGNVVCLYTAGVNRINPPWRVASRS